jgi:hypothetical protein
VPGTTNFYWLPLRRRIKVEPVFSAMRLSLRPMAAAILIASGTRLPAPETSVRTRPDSVRIYLLADTLHTGLVFDLRWLVKHGYVKPVGIGDHEFVAMSWGDEVAYLQRRWLTPGQVFRAFFTPNSSVMECIPFDWKVEEVCPHQRVYVAEIPKSAGVALAGFLNAHTERRADGTPVTIAPSSWGEGFLIRCPEHVTYDISRTCNHWTAEALAAAGLWVDAGRVPTAAGLIRQATTGANGFRLIWDPELREDR